MENTKRVIWASSILLVSLGILSLVLSLGFGVPVNSWPLALIMLGAGFFILASYTAKSWRWGSLFYAPGAMLAALGLVFLLNTITGDWNAWAYAWLIVVAGLGLGVLLASQGKDWPAYVRLAGAGAVIGGITLSVLFGAITGGRFMQVMAPILLVLGGVSLRWLRPDKILPEGFLRRPKAIDEAQTDPAPAPTDQSGLVEPLSKRELEVLALVNQGLANGEIAEKLSLAPSTVKTHINNIYGKLGVQTRIQAIKQAKEMKLIS